MIRYRPVPKASFERLKRLPELFEAIQEVELAYLFGSAASGRVGPLSDIDIACLLGPSVPENDLTAAERRLLGALTSYLETDELDLVILNHCPVPVAYQVARAGRLVFCRNEMARLRFVKRAILRHLDFVPVLEICFQYLGGDGESGGRSNG